MEDWDQNAAQFIRDHIHVWMQVPRFKHLLKALRKDEELLVHPVASIFAGKGKTLREKSDEARLFLIRHAMEQVKTVLRLEHFVLFKEVETVEVILEDAFEVELGPMEDRFVFPHQVEVARIIARCLFRKGRNRLDSKDIITYLALFSCSGWKRQLDPDRTMRYKSMVWFAYLLAEIVKNDADSVCSQDVSRFKAKIITLLERALAGSIIAEEARGDIHQFEGGKWNRTLFGWLQGEDRKPFAEKLVKQFNLENRKDHVNRLLLAEHRDCMYRQTLIFFCPLYIGVVPDGRHS